MKIVLLPGYCFKDVILLIPLRWLDAEDDKDPTDDKVTRWKNLDPKLTRWRRDTHYQRATILDHYMTKKQVSVLKVYLSLQSALTIKDAEKKCWDKSCKTGPESNRPRLEQVRGSGIKVFQEDETDRKLDVLKHWGKVLGWISHNNTGNEENKSK